MGRFLGGVFGDNIPINFGSAPEPAVYNQIDHSYIAGLGGWILPGASLKFTFVSAPAPSGLTGTEIDLAQETDNTYVFGLDSTYTLSFPSPFAADVELVGVGGRGGNGGAGIPGPPTQGSAPGSPGSPGTQAVFSAFFNSDPVWTLTATGGDGGRGGNGSPSSSQGGAPGGSGIATDTRGPNYGNYVFPGVLLIPTPAPGGAGGGGVPEYAGSGPPGNPGTSNYTGTLLSISNNAGGSGTGGPGRNSGDLNQTTAGGGGGGGGGGGFAAMQSHAFNSSFTYNITVGATGGVAIKGILP